MMSASDLAHLFSALGHPSRIEVIRALLPLADQSAAFGVLVKALGLAPSTLNHHLREMEAAGLISRREAGRTTVFSLNLPSLMSASHEMRALCGYSHSGPAPGLAQKVILNDAWREA